MRNRLLLLLFWSTITIAQNIPVAHKITKVTVYLNNAEIVRTANVSIPEGKSVLDLGQISSSINSNGIDIAFDKKDVKVLAINTTNKVNFETNSDWLAINSKLQSIKKEKELFNIRINSYEKQILFLEKNMVLTGNTPATVSQINTRADYFQKKIASVQELILVTKEKRNAIDKKIAKITKEKSKIESKIKLKSKHILIDVVSDKAVSSKLSVRYIVTNASWKPFYAINATEKNENIDFQYQAKIYNNTGNDWKNLPLTLAIIDLNENISLPVLRPWVLSASEYNSVGEGKLNNVRGEMAVNNSLMKTKVDYDVIKVDDINTRFEIKTPQNIPADATPHIVDVKNYKLPVSYYSISIPKIKKGAYLVVKIPHWRQLGLMEAEANLYYNNTYRGTTKLNTRQISDTLDVSLGKDDSFSVTRRKLKSANKTRMIGFNVTKTLIYEIVVKNIRNKAQDIEIRDQIPIAADSDIDIEIIDLADADLHKTSGQLTWKIHLKPFGTKKIVFSYKIKVPKSKAYIFDDINDNRIRSPRFF